MAIAVVPPPATAESATAPELAALKAETASLRGDRRVIYGYSAAGVDAVLSSKPTLDATTRHYRLKDHSMLTPGGPTSGSLGIDPACS